MIRRRALLLILLILGALLSAVAGALAGLIKLPEPVASQPLVALLLVGLALGGLGLWVWRLQSLPETQQVQISLARQNRQRMLARVRAIWITGVLDHSLYADVFLTLGLKDQPRAIATPGRLVVLGGDRPVRKIPAGTRIHQVFDGDLAQGELLILGVPGAGKTTVLLSLTRELLARAEQDEQDPIPAIFPLASWASKKQPLSEWMVEELQTLYQVPKQVGRAWVEHDQLLPLLDGLDEVAPEHRTACVEAINAYRSEHGLLPTVVCCRSAEYQSLGRQLRLRMAIEVQPLTDEQLAEYLVAVGPSLTGLRTILQVNPVLDTLAHTPLMLSVLSLAFQGHSADDLAAEGEAITQQRVFALYVEQMLKRQRAMTPYSSEQTKHWLSWLASQMWDHDQTIFYLEWLQPSWLAKQHRPYYRWSVGLFGGLVGGLLGGLLGGLFGGLLSGLFGVLLGGLSGVLLGGLSGKTEDSIQPLESLTWSWVGGVTYGLFAGLTVGLVLVGLVLVLVVLLLVGLGPELAPVLRSGLNKGLLGWLLVGLYAGLAVVQLGGLVGVLRGGLSSKQLTERLHLSPNEGIWRSAKNGLLVGLLVGLPGGLVGLVFGLGHGLLGGLGSGLTTVALQSHFFSTRGRQERDMFKFLTQCQIRLEMRRDLL